MKVKELKKILESCNDEAEVYFTYTYWANDSAYEAIEDVKSVDILENSICIQ